MDYFEKLKLIAEALNEKYPKGNDPFQIITRLCEEAGELAKEVNHFEDSGSKIKKYGQPDTHKLAKEVQDVFRSAWQVALYYGIEPELIGSIDDRLNTLKEAGFVKNEET